MKGPHKLRITKIHIEWCVVVCRSWVALYHHLASITKVPYACVACMEARPISGLLLISACE